uniref:Transmembrane domain-containing protein n=1 Tax=Spironucleus salmonicida TaxID=348837 RepID=V6LRD3_9EUKA|eukprot:EST43344.1 Transmembrane domain-containing protein [Spironucleus salmonicida]
MQLQHQEILITAQLYETFSFPPLTSAAILLLGKDFDKTARIGFCCCQVLIQSLLLQFNEFELMSLFLQYRELEKTSKSQYKRSNQLIVSTIPVYSLLGLLMTISPIFLLYDCMKIRLGLGIVCVLGLNIILVLISLNLAQYLRTKNWFVESKV